MIEGKHGLLQNFALRLNDLQNPTPTRTSIKRP